MQIFQDEQHGSRLRQSLEASRERLKEALALTVRIERRKRRQRARFLSEVSI